MNERAGSGSVVEVLVTERCDPCRQCLLVWRALCRDVGIPCEIVDIASPAGRSLSRGTRLSTLPAVFIRGELVAVGVQSRAEAVALLAATGCLDPDADPEQHG